VRERDTHREREVCVKARALSSLVQSSGSGTTPVSGRELVPGQRAFCEGDRAVSLSPFTTTVVSFAGCGNALLATLRTEALKEAASRTHDPVVGWG
jgi:hypothetical protein